MPYIGKKPADIIATAVDTTTGTFSGDLTVDTSTLYVDSANNLVGIGLTSNIDRKLHVEVDNTYAAKFGGTGGGDFAIEIGQTGTNGSAGFNATGTGGAMKFSISGSEAMRIDSSGNLLVGGTTTNHQAGSSQEQLSYIAGDYFAVSRSSNDVAFFNRQSTDGSIINLRKDGTTVGSIGSRAGVALNIVLDPRTNGCGLTGVGQVIRPTDESGTNEDNTIDLGSSSHRFKDLYLSGKLTNNGTGGINIDTSGNVGIGTSSPQRTLHLNESTSGSIYLHITNSTTGTTSTDGLIFGIDSSEQGYIWHYEAKNFILGTNNTERMRIDSSGNVGIGVVPNTGWSNTWDVAQVGLTGSLSGIASGSLGRTFVSDNAYNDAASQVTSWQYQIADQASQVALIDGKVELRVATAGSADADITWNQAVVVANSGKVGIGTSSPSYGISVENSTDANASGSFKRTGGSEVRILPQGVQANIGTYSNHPLIFNTNGSEQLRIASDGDVQFLNSGGNVRLYWDKSAAGLISSGAGISFDAGSNYLNDYEQGAWTPSLGGTGTNPTTSGGSFAGRYVKIGGVVTAWFDIQNTTISGGSGSLQIPISDLPFAPTFSLSGGREIAAGSCQTYQVTWPHDGTIGTRLEPSQGIQFQVSRNGGTWSTVTTANAAGSNKYFGGFITYRTF